MNKPGEGTFLFSYCDGYTYVWFFNSEENFKKALSKEHDIFFIPPSPRVIWGKNQIPPIRKIWTKGFQKQYKGAENIIGVIEAHTEENEVIISMMSVHPKYKRMGVNTCMMKEILVRFPNAVIKYDRPTKDGKAFAEKFGGNYEFLNDK